jgi:PKD repeat protein
MRKKSICMLMFIALALSVFPLVQNIKAQAAPTVSFTPSTTQVTQLNQHLTLNITISGVQNLWFWHASVTWDPAVLSLVNSPQEGDFMAQSGQTLFVYIPAKNGIMPDIDDTLETTNGVSGSGVLVTLEFQVIQSASTSIQLGNITLESPPASIGSAGGPQITPTSTSSTATISFASGGAPAANSGPAQTVTQGATVTFDGSNSMTTGSNPMYTWAFTDIGVNKTLTGINPTYTFNNPGIYPVTLTLTDSNGASTSNVTITVQSNSKPVAVIALEGINHGQSIPAGQSITFNGTGSYEPNNGTVARYLWNLGDTTQGTNATMTHAYDIPPTMNSKTYNVTLTVFDATNQNNTASTQITVVPGSSQSSSPPPTSSTQTTTHSPTSSSGESSTSTTAPNKTPQSGLPPEIIAIMIIVTVLVLGGSTVWLRKRT